MREVRSQRRTGARPREIGEWKGASRAVAVREAGLVEFEWVRVRTDVAGLRAAIEAAADRFELRCVRGERWEFVCTDPAVSVEIAVRGVDAEDAAIGLRIAPVRAEGAFAEGAGVVWFTWPIGLVILMFCHLRGYSVVLSAVLVALGMAVLVLPAAAMAQLFEARRSRRAQRYVGEWRERFMLAVAAHVEASAGNGPYR